MGSTKRRPWKPSPNVDQAWFFARFDEVGLSLRAVAEKLDIDHSSLSHMLYGKRKLQIEEAIDMARIFDVTLEEVLVRAGYPEVRNLRKR